ncbi:MAG: DUF547 domain-containing protein [Gammaproteobacteria bacterium]|nr:MAG: DUF547 domain-containing protein [Gammaproteobacteria bacterium]
MIRTGLRRRLVIVMRRFGKLQAHGLFATGVLAIVLCAPRVEAFAHKSELWERWTNYSASATASIDHSEWNTFLVDNLVPYADGVNRIAYAKVSEADKKRLKAYLSALSAVPISEFSRDEQFAYWINLYNALTMDVLLDRYPVESIRDISISPGFFTIGPWGKKLVRVEGQELSLDDIEHRILRPIWKDPRIHYAVNCAALGCPSLMPSAFTRSNTEELLERGARNYINGKHGARFDSDTRLIASSLYDWYQDDFGGDEASVIAHLRSYARPALAAKLEGITEVYDFEYDWTLNDTAPAQARQRRVGSDRR